MKQLIIARHAKSDWSQPGLGDIDRPLNKRGRRDAPVMADHLKHLGVQPDLIISSPAERAVSTASAYAERLLNSHHDLKIIDSVYGASERQLLEMITSLSDELSSVMLVGHNPVLTDLVNLLSVEGVLDMPTCSFVVIDFNAHDWKQLAPGAGGIRFFEYPKKLAV